MSSYRQGRPKDLRTIAILVGLMGIINSPLLHATDEWELHLTLASTTAGNSVPVDDETFMRLCSDSGGCLISIGVSYWPQLGVRSKAILFGMPCPVHITRDRHWVVNSFCSSRLLTAKYPKLEADGAYRQYNSGQEGIDGVQDRSQAKGDWNILSFYSACSLTEYAVVQSVKQSDDSAGFHFWMATTKLNPNLDNAWTAEAKRSCVLVIRD